MILFRQSAWDLLLKIVKNYTMALGHGLPLAAVDFPAIARFAPMNVDEIMAVETIQPAVDSDVDIRFELLRGVVALDIGAQVGIAFDDDLAGVFAEI